MAELLAPWGLDEQVADDIVDRYLTFRTNSQLFGIPIQDVVQIIGMQKITGLPDSPPYMKGVIRLRGEVFPVIDVRRRLGQPDAAYNERTCIIITHIRDRGFGFIVDEVDEVCNIADEQIVPPPRMENSAVTTYLTGIAHLDGASGKAERIILLLNITRLLREDELVSVAQALTE